jgi:hypothetical protein
LAPRSGRRCCRGFLVATGTTGLPVPGSAVTRSRCAADPDVLAVATMTASLAEALLTAESMVAAPAAVPVSNRSVATPSARRAVARWAAGCASRVSETEAVAGDEHLLPGARCHRNQAGIVLHQGDAVVAHPGRCGQVPSGPSFPAAFRSLTSGSLNSPRRALSSIT